MSQHLTLILADENVKISNDIPHFYENGYLIIPFNDETRMEIETVHKISTFGMTLNQIFNIYIDTEYTYLNNSNENILEEYKGLVNEIDDFENITLVEFLKKIKLPNFIVLSCDDLCGDYGLIFENYIYKPWPTNFRTRIDFNKEYLYQYGGCKKHCLEKMFKL